MKIIQQHNNRLLVMISMDDVQMDGWTDGWISQIPKNSQTRQTWTPEASEFLDRCLEPSAPWAPRLPRFPKLLRLNRPLNFLVPQTPRLPRLSRPLLPRPPDSLSLQTPQTLETRQTPDSLGFQIPGTLPRSLDLLDLQTPRLPKPQTPKTLDPWQS